jgi:MFS family permease
LSKKRNVGDIVRGWFEFLNRQESPFKVNIWKNLAQRFAMNLTYQYQSIYLTSLGATPLILGYIGSLNGVINTILAIPTGVLADRIGIKKVLLMTISVSIISALVFALAGSWQIAAVAMALSGVAFILDRTVCPMICGSILASHERVTGMGICDTISFFPQLIAPIIGASLITFFGGMNATGIRPLYYLQILGYGVAFLVILTKFENPSSRMGRRNEGNVLEDLRTVLREGKFVPRWLLLTMLTGFPNQVLFYIPLYAAEIKNANQFIVGGISTASTLVFVFLAIPLGHMSDTYGRKKMITVTAITVALSRLVMVWSPNNYILLLSAFMSGFNMTVIQSQMAISVDLVPAKYLGSWYGIQGFIRGIMGIIAPIMCGYLWDLISPHSVFYLLAAVQVAALAVLLTVPTEITR